MTWDGPVIRLAARVAFGGMIARMRDDPATSKIAAALTRALSPATHPEARVWFDQIEARRAQLLAQSDRVRVDDFGAGTTPHDATEQSGRDVDLGAYYRLSHVDNISSRILFELVISLQPAYCIELGTCTGMSAAYQAAALEVNGHGHLTTIEGADSLARRAATTLKSLDLHRVDVRQGSFDDVLPSVLARSGSVDFVFNDGHHLEEPTVRYFEALLPFLTKNAVVVLDDINWSAGMRRAWQRLSRHQRVEASVDLFRMGLLCLRPNAGESTRRYRWLGTIR